MSVLSGIGSILQGGTGLIGTLIGASQSKQNLDFQKQQFAYQKELNQQYLDRMDNRLQYMTADAKKAGINPLAAIGQSGGYSNQQSAQAPQLDTSYLNHLDSVGSSINQYLINAKTTADAKVALAQANQLSAQAINTTTDTELKNQMKANLKHDLSVANKLNAPTGILPDMERDMYHDIKSYIKERLDSGDKTVEKFVNNYDNGIDGAVNSIIDNIAGDSWFNKARHWLGNHVKAFNKAMVDAENRSNRRK